MGGFGGLLLLMAFAGIDGIQTLRRIEASSDEIREEFLLRTRVLERIRGDLYVSGTYVRDYLLEPESGKELWKYELGKAGAPMRGVTYWQGDREHARLILAEPAMDAC